MLEALTPNDVNAVHAIIKALEAKEVNRDYQDEDENELLIEDNAFKGEQRDRLKGKLMEIVENHFK